MKLFITITAFLISLISAAAYARCHTYTVNGRMVTCCTTGNFTNCF